MYFRPDNKNNNKYVFKDLEFNIIGNYLSFRPYLNRDRMSVFNNEFFDFNINILSLSILSILLTLILISIYIYLKNKGKINKFNFLVLSLLIAAGLCSSIDRIVWKGSLDFIVLFNYIVDFKDLYLFIGLILTILGLLRDHIKNPKSKEIDNLVLGYFKSIFGKIK